MKNLTVKTTGDIRIWICLWTVTACMMIWPCMSSGSDISAPATESLKTASPPSEAAETLGTPADSPVNTPEGSETETQPAPEETAPGKTAETPADDTPEPAEASEKEKKTIGVRRANIRTDASLQAKIDAQLEKGEAVTVLEVKDDWFHVELSSGETGWAHKSLFSDETGAPLKEIGKGDSLFVSVSTANIRKNASIESETVGKLHRGEKVSVTNIRDEWLEVTYGEGGRGWMRRDLFTARPDHAKVPGSFLLEGIRIESDGGKNRIFFHFNGPRPPKVLFYPPGTGGNKRLICDFADTRRGKGILPEHKIKGSSISTLRTGLRGATQSDLRVVFDLPPDGEYGVSHFFVKGKYYLLVLQKI